MRSKQLDELATDIQEAKRTNERAEMTQEAMNKLSHLIRAKDIEIEALRNKNESLMEILRNGDASDQSAQIINLMEQCDVLRAGNEKLRTERDQINQAYNQLEHTVVVLKGNFESLNTSYKQEIQIMQHAVNNYSKPELEINFLGRFKIRSKLFFRPNIFGPIVWPKKNIFVSEKIIFAQKIFFGRKKV